MTYDEVAELFLRPPAEPVSEPHVPASPARRLRDALEPLATQGWWARPTGERMDRLGLPFLTSYVWGRAAALGTPAPSVVVATFGVFSPTLLRGEYEAGVAGASRDDVLAARAEGASEGVDAVLDAEEASSLAGILLDALDRLDGLGRPLFSGLRELPLPPSPGGRLWRAAELVREHRGDGHLAAVATAGLDAVEANVLTEVWIDYPVGQYSGTRGFSSDEIGAAAARLEARGWLAGGQLTETGREAREAIEAATDTSQAALVEALGDRIDDLVQRMGAVSGRLVAAGSFPPDPRKRAGG